jgi:hypothetical protein
MSSGPGTLLAFSAARASQSYWQVQWTVIIPGGTQGEIDFPANPPHTTAPINKANYSHFVALTVGLNCAPIVVGIFIAPNSANNRRVPATTILTCHSLIESDSHH